MRASECGSTRDVEMLLKKKVNVVLVISEDYPKQKAMFDAFDVVKISNIPTNEEISLVLEQLKMN